MAYRETLDSIDGALSALKEVAQQVEDGTYVQEVLG